MQTDRDAAIRCFTRGGILGHVGCQRDLGVWYLEGTGVPRDEKKGFQLSLKAAVQGDNQAMFNVGMCYQLGRGVGYSLKRALDWYEVSQAAVPKTELAHRIQFLKEMPDLEKEESATGLPTGHRDALAAAWKTIQDESFALAGLSSRELCFFALHSVLNAPIQGLQTVLNANQLGLVRVLQAMAEQAERKELEARRREQEERRKAEEEKGRKAEEERRKAEEERMKAEEERIIEEKKNQKAEEEAIRKEEEEYAIRLESRWKQDCRDWEAECARIKRDRDRESERIRRIRMRRRSELVRRATEKRDASLGRLNDEIRKVQAERSAAETSLASLGFFRKREKKTLREFIAQIDTTTLPELERQKQVVAELYEKEVNDIPAILQQQNAEDGSAVLVPLPDKPPKPEALIQWEEKCAAEKRRRVKEAQKEKERQVEEARRREREVKIKAMELWKRDILSLMKGKGWMRISQIATMSPEVRYVSSQKLSDLLRSLYVEGKIDKKTEGMITYFKAMN